MNAETHVDLKEIIAAAVFDFCPKESEDGESFVRPSEEHCHELAENIIELIRIKGFRIYPVPKNLWSSDEEHDRASWKDAVRAGDTNLGYFEWVANKKETCELEKREKDYDAFMTGLGFGFWNTGGNCTAWGMNLPDGGSMLVTRGEDPVAPSSHEHKILVVRYDEDGIPVKEFSSLDEAMAVVKLLKEGTLPEE